MLRVSEKDVVSEPFPHITSTEILEPGLYAALRSDFPDLSLFEKQKSITGVTGSRTGQGFDIYRGDVCYNHLLETSESWRVFDGYINSSKFVDNFLSIFGDYLGSLGCLAEIASENYDQTYIEERETLNQKPTVSDRFIGLKRKILPGNLTRKSVKIFSRLDIQKAMVGYDKPVHCDRGNRLSSLIIYFSDTEKSGSHGGELTIHRHKIWKPINKYERHPSEADTVVVAKIKPKENLGVFFPCCNNSYHGVTAVTAQSIERDYLYINLSAVIDYLW